MIYFSVDDTFRHLHKVLRSEHFRAMRGLNNEVPFFICPYPPRETVAMEQGERALVKKLTEDGVPVCAINLYDLAVEMIQQRKLWDRLLASEGQQSRERILEVFENVLDPETHLIPAIVERMATTPHDILFLSGVGTVFPYLRAPTILNNLQRAAKEKPTLMFFPGTYTQSPEKGATLKLFGRLPDDNYYRAFNILERDVP